MRSTRFDETSRTASAHTATATLGPPTVFAAVVLSAGLTLWLAMVCLIASQEVRFLTTRLTDGLQASVFLDPRLTRSDAEALRARLDRLPAVGAAVLRTKEEAMAALAADGLPPLAGGTNPLPDVWVVTLRLSAEANGRPLPLRVAAARDALAGLPGVASVDVDLRWLALLDRWTSSVEAARPLVTGGILAVSMALLSCIFVLAARASALHAELVRDGKDEPPMRALALAGLLWWLAAGIVAGLAVVAGGAVLQSVGIDWKPIAERTGQMSLVPLATVFLAALSIAVMTSCLRPTR